MHAIRRFIRATSGSSAIEFALVAPLFLLILFTLVAYALYLSAASTVEQLAANASRMALAGLDATERRTIAEEFVDGAVFDHILIDASALDLSIVEDAAAGHFTVRLTFDAETLPIWNLVTFPMPATEIERNATIRISGL